MANTSQIIDALECAVCFDTLSSDNRVLPCQHTFCRSCLNEVKQSHQDKLSCPECRLEVTDKIDDLPSSIILKRILNNLAGIKLLNQQSTPKKRLNLIADPPGHDLQASPSTPSCSYADSQLGSSFSFINTSLTPSSSQGTPSSSKKNGIHNVVPCTVEQVNRIMFGLQDEINGYPVNKMVLIGKVATVDMNNSGAFTEYDIDDGTTPEYLTIRYFGDNLVFDDIQSYVKVFGRIQSYKGTKQFLALHVQMLKEMNELTSHMLEIVRNSLAHSKAKEMESDLECLALSDSSSSTVATIPSKKTVKRRLQLDDDSSGEESIEQTPKKKERRRPKVLEESSSESKSDFGDEMPPLTSTAKKGMKKINISEDDISSEDDMSNISSTSTDLYHQDEDTDHHSGDDINEGFNTPDRPVKASEKRSSERIQKKNNKIFHMPSRSKVFDAIDTSHVSERSLDELRERKVVNDFTKVTSRYNNYDPNYTSEESDENFIDDDFEYIDHDQLISEDSNYNSGKENKKKSNTKSEKKDKRKVKDNSRLTKRKRHCNTIVSTDTSSESSKKSDSNAESPEEDNANKKKKQKSSAKQKYKHKSSKPSIKSTSDTGETSESENSSDTDQNKVTMRKSKHKNKRNRGKSKRNDFEASSSSEVDNRKEKHKKKYSRKVKSSEDDYDSDIGDLSKSILDKVSERSRIMTKRKKEKQDKFNALKEKRAAKIKKK